MNCNNGGCKTTNYCFSVPNCTIIFTRHYSYPLCMKLIPGIFFILAILVPAGIPVAAQETSAQESDAGSTDTASEISEASQSIREYQDQIKKQESVHGAFDPQLGEQLLGLGLVYKKQGQYDEAGEALERSLHIKRVNEGVDNMSQLPILDALIDANTAAGNWEKLDKNYDLLLQVNQRNLGSGDVSVLTNIERVGEWKLTAYNNGLLKKKPNKILYDLIDINQSTIKIIEDLYGKNDPRLITPLNNLSLAHFLLFKAIKEQALGEFQGTQSRTSYHRVCSLVRTRNGYITVCSAEPVADLTYYYSRQTSKNTSLGTQMNSVMSPLNRIVKIIGTKPAMTPRELAYALVDVGDWYFVFDMHDAAIKSYKYAFQLLMEDGAETDDVDKMFGRPARIPSIPGDSDINNAFTSTQSEPYVRLSFDVGEDGKPTNINVIEEGNTKNFIARKRAKERVKSWLFRPRFQDGEPVATQDVEIKLSGEILKKPAPESGPVERIGSRIRR